MIPLVRGRVQNFGSSMGSLLIGLIWAHASYARPLTEQDLKGAKEVIFFFGTFDPPHLGHLDLAKAAQAESPGALIIFVPSPSPSHKDPVPYPIRSELVEMTIDGYPQLVSPSAGAIQEDLKRLGPRTWAASLKKKFPNLKTSVLLGQDVVNARKSPFDDYRSIDPTRIYVGERKGTTKQGGDLTGVTYLAHDSHSSTKIREYLFENPDVYFPDDAHAAHTVPGLHPRVAKTILTRGIYLGLRPDNSVRLSRHKLARLGQKIKIWLEPSLRPLTTPNKLKRRELRRKTLARPEVESIFFNGTSYSVIQFAGNGMNANTYRIEYEGQTVIAKKPRESVSVALDFQQLISHRWLTKHSNLNLPLLLDYDPESRIALYEDMGSTTLANHLNENPTLSAELLKQLEAIHLEAKRLWESAGIKLDIEADNLMIRNGKVFLVDVGFTTRPRFLTDDFETVLKHWRLRANIQSEKPSLWSCLVRKLSK